MDWEPELELELRAETESLVWELELRAWTASMNGKPELWA